MTQYEKAYIFNNLIKCNFCNFTFWMPRAVAPFAPSAHHWYYGKNKLMVTVKKLLELLLKILAI